MVNTWRDASVSLVEKLTSRFVSTVRKLVFSISTAFSQSWTLF